MKEKQRRPAKNLTLDPRITELADLHISRNRKLRSFSHYVETLVIRDLRRKGVRLPSAYATI